MGLYNRIIQAKQGARIMSNKSGGRFNISDVVNTTGIDQLRKAFMREVLNEDITYIKEEQQVVAEYYQLFEPRTTGNLLNSIRNKFTLSDQGLGFKAEINYVKYIRFLDMKHVQQKRKSYHLYNRIIWGVLFNRTTDKLLYGFTEEVKDRLRWTADINI
jgi:hypothetical protein